MSLDGAFLHIIKAELAESGLIGARVDKINQPSRDEIIITFRAFGKNPRLLVSANGNCTRVGLTSAVPENPKTPPMFCVLLRKHLRNGRLTAVTQDGLERILRFDFECANEIGDEVQNSLIAEIMGRTSNIILVDGNDRVIDSIKRVTSDISSVRRVLPNIGYVPPPRDDRHCLLDCDVNGVVEGLEENWNDKTLLKTLEGVSPVFTREAVFYSGGDKSKLAEFLSKAKSVLTENKPEITLISEKGEHPRARGAPRDFCFVDIGQYGGEMIVSRADSANGLLDGFFGVKADVERLKQRAGSLMKTLANAYERVQRRLSAQKRELLDCAGRERLRIRGDLINANIYRLEKGATFLEAENYVTGEIERIELDARLTPAQNAQKYYAAYRKADNAEKMLSKLLADGERELTYLESVIDAAERAFAEDELNEIRRELNAAGYIKLPSAFKKSGREKPLPPIKFTASDGAEILVGRNNRQNDELTLKIAKSDDVWLHTKDIAGSHVILRCSGRAPVPETIAEAAAIAAYCSKGRDSGRVPVDYTFARYVKKPSGAKPGYVTFTNNKTLYVTPDEEIYDRLRVDDKLK
ncbi:MAG: NFACT family protein [Oscillospiraceae bacterium]|jgi:predicted ribosome quality control (RQC) complex YloA/Tae2 family protein|nr:NFACT family protein [Oscillospiraceae bacterium]